MKKVLNRAICSSLLLLVLLSGPGLQGQIFSNKKVGHKVSKSDTLAARNYHHILPLMGRKALAAGYDLPKAAGIGINYIWQQSDLLVNNVSVGLNNSPLMALDEIVRFNDIKLTTQGVSIKPDFWLLPFLNVYAIFAQTQNTTGIDFSVYAPNHEIHEALFGYSTQIETQATTKGFGLTPTIGVGGGWLALDMNFSWTDTELLHTPTYTFIFGPRLGKSFQLKKPESSLSFWAGGFRVATRRATSGSIVLGDALAGNGNLQQNLTNASALLEQKHLQVEDWWRGLPPALHTLYGQTYESIQSTLNNATELLYRLEAAAQQPDQSVIEYSVEQRHRNTWNFVLGSQYQLNKSWMIHFEYGFLGSRKHFFGGLQYRLDM